MKIAAIVQWDENSLDKAKQILSESKKTQFDQFIVCGQTEWQIYNTRGFQEIIEAAGIQNKKVTAIAAIELFCLFLQTFTQIALRRSITEALKMIS